MISMSKHAREQWVERVGTPPPAAGRIKRMLRQAIVIQKQRELFTRIGAPYRLLSSYWCPQEAVILKVDESCGKVVTVLGPQMRRDFK